MSKLKQLYAILLASIILIPGIYLLSFKVMAEDGFDVEKEMAGLQMIEQTTLLPLAAPPKSEISQTINVIVTGYSSTVCQTDNDPFITASGEVVRDGIVANNMLTFGTQIKLPEIFGSKTFVVKDRMHSRKGDYHVDIWFPTKQEALEFGAKTVQMFVLAN